MPEAYIFCARAGEDARIDAQARATKGAKVPCSACAKLVWLHPCMAHLQAAPLCTECAAGVHNPLYVLTDAARRAAEGMAGMGERN